MFYTNADQALNKKDGLLVMISVEKLDIIILTRVIPKAQTNSILLSQLAIPAYNLYVNFDYNATDFGKSGKRGIIVYFLLLLVLNKLYFRTVYLRNTFWQSLFYQTIFPLLLGVYTEVQMLIKLKVPSCLVTLFRKCVIDSHHICY